MTDRPSPVFFVEYEGGRYRHWGNGRTGRIHAIIFEDGSVFDAVNGWRDDDPETLRHARECAVASEAPELPEAVSAYRWYHGQA